MSANTEPAPLHGAELVLVSIAISLTMFMEVLDMTIVNVSVPAISGTLGVSPSEGTWTISSYTMAAAIMQPLTGWLGRRFGEVRIYLVSTLLFVGVSMLCGLATSMPMLIACRILQGAVSGPMAPMAQALLLRSFPPEKRGLSVAIWGMVIMVAPVLGPVLGGLITDNLSWPWLFFINLPVGILGATITWALLRSRETTRMYIPVDAIGMALLVFGVAALQFMLDFGNEKDWFDSGIIVIAAVVALVCLTLLIAWELTDRHAALDLHLFKFHNFRIGLLIQCLGYGCMFGGTVMFPLFLQTSAHYTATWAGLSLAPMGITGILLMPFVAANLKRIDMRWAVTGSFMLMSVSMYMTSHLNDSASFWDMTLPRLIMGLSMPLFFVPLQQIVFSDVDAAHMASAAGLSNFFRNISASLSTAVSIWLWNTRTDFHHVTLTQHVSIGGNWSLWSDQLGDSGLAGANALAYTESVVTQQAQTLSSNDVFTTFAVLLIVLVPVIWLARPPFRTAGTAIH